MNEEIQEKLRAMAQRECEKNQAVTAAGIIGGCGNAAMGLDTDKPSLRNWIKSQLRRASNEAQKANALSELEYLLDKNPEVARILDLLEQVGK